MKITEELEKIKQLIDDENMIGSILEMKKIAKKYNKTDITNCFINNDKMEYMVADRQKFSKWQDVACFLAEVKNTSADFYYIDKRKNAYNVNVYNVKSVFGKLSISLENEILEQEPICKAYKFIITLKSILKKKCEEILF